MTDTTIQTMDRIEQALPPLPVTEERSENGKVSVRVRRHRERLAKEGCARLDVTIGADVLGKLREVAKQRGIPIWHAAEEAVGLLAITYGVTGNKENGNG